MSRTEPDESDRLLAAIQFTRTVALQWLLGSVVGFFAFAYGIGSLLAAVRGRTLEPITIAVTSATALSIQFAAALALVAVVVVVHELLHGVFLSRYGGDPDYGVGVSHFVLPYAYAETEGTRYTRNQLLVVLLAPFVAITAVGVLALLVHPSPLLLLALAINAAGSIGDLWTAAVLWQYPADVRVAGLPDSSGGFGIYAASDDVRGRRPGAATLATFCAGAAATLAALVTGTLAVVFCSLAFGSGTVVLADPDGRWFLLRHERLAGGGAALEVGAPLVALLSMLGGLGWTVVTRLRRHLNRGEP